MMRYALKDMIIYIKNFLNDTKGISAILFAVTAPVVLVAAGGAIDYGMAYHNKHKLQYAIDSAALSGNVLDGRTRPNIRNLIKDVAVANFDNNMFASLDPNDIEVDLSDLSKIRVTAKLTNNNIFLPLFNTTVESTIVAVEAETKKPLDGLEIALVLDNSNSMRHDNKLQGLKDAANQFIDIIMDDIPIGNEIRVGIVPYSRGVNVGYYGVGRDLDGGSYSGGRFVTFNSGDDRVYFPFSFADLRKSDGTYRKNVWNGCVYEEMLADTNGLSHNQPWRPFQVCYDQDGENVYPSNEYMTGGVQYLNSDFSYDDNLWQDCKDVTSIDTPTGVEPPWYDDLWCYSPDGMKVLSNVSPVCHAPGDHKRLRKATAPSSPDPRKVCRQDGVVVPCRPNPGSPARIETIYYNPNTQCNAASMLPLQSSDDLSASKDNLKTVIDSMEYFSTNWKPSTYTEVGLAWAYHILSPSRPFREAENFYNNKWAKSVVLMSDGLIETTTKVDSPYVGEGPLRGAVSDHSSESREIFRNVCNKLKNQDITIYTIQFGADMNSDAVAKNDFVNCASDSSKFYFAADNDDLIRAFQDIAESLGKSRLLK